MAASIHCARTFFPYLDFEVSNQSPPLEFFDDGFFGGAYATSVWSHFSVEAGRQWLGEMHRIVKPGGFLIVTTVGYFQLAKQLLQQRRSFEFLDTALTALKTRGHYFANTIRDGHRGLQASEWGLLFVDPDWFEQQLLDPQQWAVRCYGPGRWGDKQDVFVLERL